jgi:16S rRNA (uracil1498-N3)-methyltransferase
MNNADAAEIPDGAGGPHVFVEDIDTPELSTSDHHHLSRVRRLRDGAPITIGDGAGKWRSAAFALMPEPTGPVVMVDRPTPTITVVMAPVKADRTSFAVQKLTEVGVDRIVFVHCARSVVRWDGSKAKKIVARLQLVARSAAEQSRQVWIPEIEGPFVLDDVLARDGVAVAERGGSVVNLSHPTMIIGPEGGWDKEEIGPTVPTVSLGPSVLRAETAAITAGVLLTALRTGLVRGHAE